MARAIRPAVAVLGALGAVASLTLTACTKETARDATGAVTESAAGADVFSIKVGDCTGALSTGDLTELDAIPCGHPHKSEAFAAIQVGDGDYPGADAVKTQADDGCSAEFETFVGVAYDDSELFLTSLTPTEDSWAQGDREILCLVYDDDAAETTGSLKDANR